MNRIYRSIWNSRTNTFTAVSELARSAGKATTSGLAGTVASSVLTLKTLVASLMIAGMAAPVWAADLPTNGNVVTGNGTISQNGTSMTIHQGTDKLGIDWNSFNIGQGNSVTFVQPSASSVALNRVLGSDPSSIMGSLSANGQVFLVNPNGVLFGSSAQVNVGGLVASTLDISNQDFVNGKYAFKGNGTNQSVVNKGTIHADGGVVALLGGRISNEGIIQAKAGTVALAAGNAMTLDFAGDGLVSIAVDEGTANALVENKQLIEVEGGHVILSAQAADTAASVVINQAGVIRALSTVEKNGKIILSSNGDVAVSGTLDVANNDGQGGDIEITGRDITLTQATLNANGKTGGGTIKIGGDYQGQGTLAHAKNVTVDQDSTLTADATHTGAGGTIIAWSDGKTSATGSFSAKGKTGNGGLVETSGKQIDFNGIRVNTLSEQGKAGEWLIDPTDLTVDAAAAATINTNLQTSNVTLLTDATTATGPGTQTSGDGNININSAIGWDANTTLTLNAYNNINVNAAIKATGNAAGLMLNYGSNGNAAANYNVKAPITLSGTGATLRINGNNYVLIRTLNQLASVSNSRAGYFALGNSLDLGGATYSFGIVRTFRNAVFAGMGQQIRNFGLNSTSDYSGLFAYVEGGEIRDLGVVNAHVKGTTSVGILVGGATGNGNKIHNVYVTGTVSANGAVGGLIGYASGVSISDAYASVNVTSTGSAAGGFVGMMNTGTITNSYATGTVQGEGTVGGFAGSSKGTITNAYATGMTQGSHVVGGFIGSNTGTLSNVFWDSFSTGRASDGGVPSTALTSNPAESGAANNAYKQSAYSGFDFDNTWFMIEGETRPFLRSEYSTTITNAHQLQLMAMDRSAHYTLANDVNAAATKGSNLSDMWTSRGFVPIGTPVNTFNGTLDGQSRVINDLTIKRTAMDAVGLIGVLAPVGTIQGVGLVNVDITGQQGVGSLVGANAGTIRNAFATGMVRGQSNVGGLVGQMTFGSLSNAYATSDVSGTVVVGGLVGSSSSSSILNTYAAGKVTGISNSTGALVGRLTGGDVRNSYAMGEVMSNGSNAGRLVAMNEAGGVIESSYYATTDAAGRAINDGLSGDGSNGTGKRHDELMQSSTFADWSLDNAGGTGSVWRIYDGYTTPLLRSFLKQVTVTIDPQLLAGKVYDGQAISGTAAAYSKSVAGASLSGALDYATRSANAGIYEISDGSLGLSGLYSGQTGYDISYANGSTVITPKTLTISGVVADNKIYDGLTTATLTNAGTLNGVVAGEALTLVSAAEFDTKDADTGKTVRVDYDLANGNNGLASNYVLTTKALTTTANVTQKTLTVSGVFADNKIYDGTTTATLENIGTLQGLVTGEVLTLSASTAEFDTQHADTGKTVTVAYTITNGNNGLASNYVLSSTPVTTTANVAQKTLTVSGIAADNKIYDGTTAATLTNAGTLNGLVAGEALTFTSAAEFDTKDANTGKTVTATYDLANGNNGLASNYVLSSTPVTTTANVTQKTLTISDVVADNKIYDGLTTATLTNVGTLHGVVAGESLTLVTAAEFNNKDADTGKTVRVDYDLANGNNGLASNYVLSSTFLTTTADVTQKTLTISGVAADNKVYDGTTSATLVNAGTLNGLVAGEALTFTSSAEFDTKDADTGKTVTATYALANGNNGLASNYVLSSTPVTTTANITQKTLTISGVVADNKTYDGTTSATLANAGALHGLVAGEELTFSVNTAEFDTQHANTGKTVTATYDLANGNNGLASNYVLSSTPVTTTANITQKTLTISGVAADNKTYDGTTVATLANAGTLHGLITGEALTLISSAEFDTKHADTGKTVTATYDLANGNNGLASNYVLSSTTLTTTADVAAKAINGTISAGNKTYDGNTSVVLTGASQGFVAGDQIGIAATGHFIDASTGQNKNIVIDTAVLSGVDAGNYVLVGYNQTTEADINATSALPTDYARLPARPNIVDGIVNPGNSRNNGQDLFEVVGTGLLENQRVADRKSVPTAAVSSNY